MPARGPRDGAHLPQPAAGRCAGGGAAEPLRPSDDLTEREVEILRLVALGHTNVQIGEQLYFSVRTMESHRAHIQQKLRRSSRAELVRYALEHGLLDETD